MSNAKMPSSKSRVGVYLPVAVLAAILVGILATRHSGDDVADDTTQTTERREDARDVSAPTAPIDVPETTERKRQRALPSNREASTIPEGTDEGDIVESQNAFMARLREMWMVQPEVALRLAEEGERRFKDTPNAAECAWIAIRAMVEMGDFSSAEEKSEEMVETYHGTHWAMDIQRHMLSHPPGK